MAKTTSRHNVAALAGRRIDAPDAEKIRFPLDSIDRVSSELAKLFEQQEVGKLVCSAACGADLLALTVARSMAIECQIILPFEPSRFKATSVVDRAGNWGQLFDQVVLNTPKENLIVLNSAAEPDEAYEAATQEIIIRAIAAAKPRKAIAIAIAVWEGSSRADADATASFLHHAQFAGMTTRTIKTC